MPVRTSIFLIVCGHLCADVLPTTSIVFDNVPNIAASRAEIKDVIWDQTRQRFLVSLGRNTTDVLNHPRIAFVNPINATEESSIPTVDVPNHLAISDDGQSLWANFD